jgi:hypothetical protein
MSLCKCSNPLQDKTVIIMKRIKYIGWVATCFGLSGQILMIFESPLAFVTWSVAEGLLLLLALKRKSWGEVSFFTVYVITNLIALAVWTKGA